MARRRSGALLTRLRLDRESPIPVSHQLEEQLRDVIRAGQLPGGTRLPSSRALAAELGVSRPTVVAVLERLGADGFLEARRGAGTFVTETPPPHLPPMPAEQGGNDQGGNDQGGDDPGGDGQPPRSSGIGARLLTLDADIDVREDRVFLPNTPAYDHFPFALWQNCVNRQTRRAYRGNMGYPDPAGYEPLRRAIASYLALHRSDACDPEQIVITPGAHAAFMIAAQLLTDPGDGLLFEDPGPFIARHLFQSLGRRLIHVPVDAEGMDFEAAVAASGDPRLAFVMPSRQHPLGRALSASRRQRLLDWARASDAWIIEDDYDSEFRYTGRPLPSMRGIDAAGRTIYVGTFSKALFPALRIGYLVLPPALVGMFRNAMALIFRGMPVAPQMALAEFIAEGHFATHLRRMRELYAGRRERFLAVAGDLSAGLYHVEKPDSGMNVVAWLPDGTDDRAVSRRAVAAGVHCYPLSDYSVNPRFRPGLLMGFTGVAEHQLAPGLRRLGIAISETPAAPEDRRPAT
ncbi:PLP-dependent aminotransferase family protein [Amaricoccus sp. W119]|uniref:MocR-like pyridoxine biosynthesis transcription factor PdxR n=1 Tax=Amaricoccus sp. W119 TaxID=3391833 RepID=UPI0039A61AFE